MFLGIRPICPKLSGFQWLLSKDFLKIPFLGVCDSLLGVPISAQELLCFNLMLQYAIDYETIQFTWHSMKYSCQKSECHKSRTFVEVTLVKLLIHRRKL